MDINKQIEESQAHLDGRWAAERAPYLVERRLEHGNDYTVALDITPRQLELLAFQLNRLGWDLLEDEASYRLHPSKNPPASWMEDKK